MSLTRLTPILLVAALLLAACLPRVMTFPVPTKFVQPSRQLSQALASPTAESNQPTPTEVVTETAAAFILALTPAATETPLPTLEVPTEVARPPALAVWDGLPTYLADSQGGYYFRVQFDPNAWALTTDYYGFPALVHRAITNCILSPAAGRGLPPNASVEQEMRRINGISYQISTTSVNGVKQFVTYSAGDGKIFTAFQLTLQDRPDQCILEAETVLGTLASIPVSEATPVATP
ncbi:MAG TPA: hypothetical protein VF784_13000 [Anaerolineales bacterium]